MGKAMSVLNQHVLVLNRLWQAVNVCTARRALTLLFQGHAQVVVNADDGSFRLVAMHGPVILMGGPNDVNALSRYKHPVADPKYPQYFPHPFGEGFPTYLVYGGGMSPVQGTWCKVLNIKPGDVELYIGYGGKDEFNIDAQVESFLFFAKKRGIEPYVVLDPKGRHRSETGRKMMPEFAAWLTPLIEPFAPPACQNGAPK